MRILNHGEWFHVVEQSIMVVEYVVEVLDLVANREGKEPEIRYNLQRHTHNNPLPPARAYLPKLMATLKIVSPPGDHVFNNAFDSVPP